jgi:hypothetical protein
MGEVFFSKVVNLGPLGSQSNPAVNAAQLRTAGITTDGGYWLDPEASGTPYLAYIRFGWLDGGDWELVLKVHNQGDMPSGNLLWRNQTLQNAEDMNLTSGNFAKYAGWNRRPFNRVAMEMWQSGQAKVPPIMIYNTQINSMNAAIQVNVNATNQGGLRCNSTDPAMGNFVTYHNMPMKLGSNFTDVGGSEDRIHGWGIGLWANNSTNSTTAEGLSSMGVAGSWIGGPMDEATNWTFNALNSTGADSGFGFGASTGNPAKTTSAGYSEWTNTSSTNTLPAYLWVR